MTTIHTWLARPVSLITIPILAIALTSCASIKLDLSDLKFPVMLNPYPLTNSVELEAHSFDYVGQVSEYGAVTGQMSSQELVNDAQEVAFEMIGGSPGAGITDVEIHLRSWGTFPLIAWAEYIEAKVQGVTRRDR